jgi:hypothetical protein
MQASLGTSFRTGSAFNAMLLSLLEEDADDDLAPGKKPTVTHVL